MATIRVSTAADGTQGNSGSGDPMLSANGTRVVFSSDASNLVPGDTNSTTDIFLRDLTTGAITRVSTSADGTQGNGNSFMPFLSADGTKVAFESTASNLVSGDTNGTTDIFYKDLTTGAITRASVASDGTQSNGNSFDVALSADGTKAAFESNADNLVPGDTNAAFDVFEADVPCYCTGTLIRTARGDVAVEDLVVGDRAVTASGTLRPITWIGHRDLDGHGRALIHDRQPIRVRRGAFGPALPARNLFLSPGHPVLVGADADGEGGVLVPVMCLINGTSIAREPASRITYWHVELDAHDILLAEGLSAESYLDWGDRAFFAEGSDHALHNPDFVAPGLPGRCRPVVVDGPMVEAERVRLDAVFASELA